MIRLLVAVVAALLMLTGCGGSRSAESGQTGGSDTTASDPAASPSGAAPAPQSVVIDVSIAGGTVSPTNESFTAKVGEPIVVRVDSDAADELHVHSTPEHSFPIAAAKGQSFQFTVDVPGRVDVELHEADKTIASIQVQ